MDKFYPSTSLSLNLHYLNIAEDLTPWDNVESYWDTVYYTLPGGQKQAVAKRVIRAPKRFH